jgi:hypothetical protein
MAQQHRLGKGNTTVSADANGLMVVTFHSTQVVKFNDKIIVLNSGGYHTATTKTRINQASSQFNLEYSVSQRDYSWYVTFKGKEIDFTDNMTLKR